MTILSCQEVYERMDKGLCLFCEELDSPGHYHLKHKRVQIFMTVGEDDELSNDNNLDSVDLKQGEDHAKTIPEEKLNPQLGQNIEHLEGKPAQTVSAKHVSPDLNPHRPHKPSPSSPIIQTTPPVSSIPPHPPDARDTIHEAEAKTERETYLTEAFYLHDIRPFSDAVLNLESKIYEEPVVDVHNGRLEPDDAKLEHESLELTDLVMETECVQPQKSISELQETIPSNSFGSPQFQSQDTKGNQQKEWIHNIEATMVTDSTKEHKSLGLTNSIFGAKRVWEPGGLPAKGAQWYWPEKHYNHDDMLQLSLKLYRTSSVTKTLFPLVSYYQNCRRRLGKLTWYSSASLEEWINKRKIEFIENRNNALLLSYHGLEVQALTCLQELGVRSHMDNVLKVFVRMGFHNMKFEAVVGIILNVMEITKLHELYSFLNLKSNSEMSILLPKEYWEEATTTRDETQTCLFLSRDAPLFISEEFVAVRLKGKFEKRLWTGDKLRIAEEPWEGCIDEKGYSKLKRLVDVTPVKSEQKQLELSIVPSFQILHDDESILHGYDLLEAMLLRVLSLEKQKKDLKTWKFKYKPDFLLRVLMNAEQEQISDHGDVKQLICGSMKSHMKHKWRSKQLQAGPELVLKQSLADFGYDGNGFCNNAHRKQLTPIKLLARVIDILQSKCLEWLNELTTAIYVALRISYMELVRDRDEFISVWQHLVHFLYPPADITKARCKENLWEVAGAVFTSMFAQYMVNVHFKSQTQVQEHLLRKVRNTLLVYIKRDLLLVQHKHKLRKYYKSRMFKYKEKRQESDKIETQQQTLKFELGQSRDYKEEQNPEIDSMVLMIIYHFLKLQKVRSCINRSFVDSWMDSLSQHGTELLDAGQKMQSTLVYSKEKKGLKDVVVGFCYGSHSRLDFTVDATAGILMVEFHSVCKLLLCAFVLNLLAQQSCVCGDVAQSYLDHGAPRDISKDKDLMILTELLHGADPRLATTFEIIPMPFPAYFPYPSEERASLVFTTHELTIVKKMIPSYNKALTKVFVDWKLHPPDQATWQFNHDFLNKYLLLILEDKDSQQGSIVTGNL